MEGAIRWVEFTVSGERYALPVESVTQVVGLEELQPTNQTGWAGLLPLRGRQLPLADGAALLGGALGTARGRGLVVRGRVPLGFTVDAVLGVIGGKSCPLAHRVGLPDLAVAALPRADGASVILAAEKLWQRLRAGLEQEPSGAGYRLRSLRTSNDWSGATAQAAPAAPVAAVAAVAAEAVRPAVVPSLVPTACKPGGGVETPSVQGPVLGQPVPGLAEPESSPMGRAGGGADSEARSTQVVGTPGPTATEPLAPEVYSYLVFSAGLEVALAVLAEQVIEVVGDQTASPVHGRTERQLGLSRHRGRLVPLIDLPARLGQETEGARQTLYIRLASRSGQTLALSVTGVRGRVELGRLVPPDRDYGVPVAWVRGVGQIDGQVVLVLDPNSVVLI